MLAFVLRAKKACQITYGILIQESLSFQDKSQFKCKGGQKPTFIPPKPVVGVIGAASSAESVMVANILRLFKVGISLKCM